MHYEEGIGSYCNDDYERILDTEFRFDIPYLVDKEKYAAVLEKYNQGQRVRDADVVVFSCEHDEPSTDWPSNEGHWAFFAHPINSPEGSDDFYECVLFGYMSQLPVHQYEPFVHDMMDCVIGPSVDHCTAIQSDIRTNMQREAEYIDMIDNIINQTNK